MARKKKRQRPATELVDINGEPLPREFNAFEEGLHSEWDPTPASELNLLIFGQSGTGKTTFLMSNPNAWVLDFESFARDVPNPRARRVYFSDFDRYIDLLFLLIEEGREGRHPCKHIGFDSIDVFYEKIAKYLGKKQNDSPLDWFGPGRCINNDIRNFREKGAGWSKMRGWVGDLFENLTAAGYGWSCTCHQYEDVSDAGDRLLPMLPEKSLAPIYFQCHIQTAVIRETISKKEASGKYRKIEGKRRPIMKTVRADQYLLELGRITSDASGCTGEAKARYLEFLPETVELGAANGWDSLEGAWNEAIKRAQKNKPADRELEDDDPEEEEYEDDEE